MLITKLLDYTHFIDLTNEFDHKFKTKTYILKTTLKNCNDLFLKKDIFENIDNLLKNVFNKQDVIQSHDKFLKEDYSRKLYSFYNIVKDLQNNKIIKHPLSLHYFGNYKAALSPGSGRINFCNQYNRDIDIIITDYSNNFIKDYNTNITEIFDYNFDCVDLSFLFAPIRRNSPRALWKICKKNINYKSCIHVNSINSWQDIQKIKDFYLYEYRNDEVFVNNHRILYKKNENWYFDI